MAGMRLLCRVHNQYAAERTFGAEFMERKREEARRVAARGAKERPATACGTNQVAVAEDDSNTQGNDVVPYLQRLGFRVDETRRAATFCDRLTRLRWKFAFDRHWHFSAERLTGGEFAKAAAAPRRGPPGDGPRA